MNERQNIKRQYNKVLSYFANLEICEIEHPKGWTEITEKKLLASPISYVIDVEKEFWFFYNHPLTPVRVLFRASIGAIL